MPWDCKSCNHTVEEDGGTTCPSCGTDKNSWTLVADSTRTFAVTRAKGAEYLRGESDEPTEQQATYSDATCADTEEAISVDKLVVCQLHEAGKQPPPEHLLVIRMLDKGKPISITLTPEFETQALEELQFEPKETDSESEAGDTVDLRFLFVHGSSALPEGYELPGVHVVDISEETDAGYAPQIVVKAMSRRKKTLPVRPIRPFVWST